MPPHPDARPGAGPRHRKPVSLPPAFASDALLIRLAPGDVGMFRFLLEAHDNLALFTVLEAKTALLKLIFSPHQKRDVLAALDAMQECVALEISERPVAEWPTPPA